MSSESDREDGTISPWLSPMCSLSASTCLPDTPMTDDEKRKRQIEAHRLIKEKYDAGVPLFTKDLLRDIARQLEDSSSEAVSVTGLNGVAVQYPFKTAGWDEVKYSYRPDHFGTRSTPHLKYRKIQDLLEVKELEWYRDKYAYVSVGIDYALEILNVHTNKIANFTPVCDYDTVSRAFERKTQSLQDSEQFTQLKATLASAAVPSGIDKIVAFACCTMTGEANAIQTSHSMGQHSLVVALRDFLTSRGGTAAPGESGSEIRCYAQDPIYTSIDKQVLRDVGITVVDDPKGFLEVDEASVVFCSYPNIPIRQIVADIARPALIIWNGVVQEDGGAGSCDPESSRVWQMMEEYVELPFPFNNQYGLDGKLAMYVRKSG